MPLFSVVIPLYNKRDTVARALNSVLAQGVQDLEVIIVNDGSTDGSEMVVAGFADPRIRIIQQVNQGVSAARNRGIAEARADLIAFLDADDEWLPEFLATIGRMAARYPQCNLYGTRYFLQNTRGERRPAVVRGLASNFEGILADYFRVAARSSPPVCSSAVCARRLALKGIQGFPVGVRSGEDLLTWARLAARGPVAYSMECLAVFVQSAAETCEVPPSREPESSDAVGAGLASLHKEIPKHLEGSVRQYRAFWHKMRASCFLRLGRSAVARREILMGLRQTVTAKLLVYWVLSLCPSGWVRGAFRMGTLNR